MILGIQKGSTIKAVQHHFNLRYPYLKIELMKNSAGKEEKIPENDSFFNNTVAFISIEKSQTVARLEQDFWEKAGLKARVFRRFCNVWIETTLTDDWTLEQQNKEGELLSELNKDMASA